MVSSNSFKAWIEVGNHRILQEYDPLHPHVNEGTSVVRWIASEENESFAVHWQDVQPARRSYATAGCLSIDGVPIGARVLTSANTKRRMHMSGVPETATRERPFKFSPLDLTDEDDFLGMVDANKLGSIELDVWKVSVGESDDAPVQVVALPGENKIHERTKKAGGHVARTGQGRSTGQRYDPREAKFVGEAPIASFKFLYCPLPLLRANGIVPPNVKVEDAQEPSSALRSRARGEPQIKQEAELHSPSNPATKRRRDSPVKKEEVKQEETLTFLADSSAAGSTSKRIKVEKVEQL